VLQPTESQALVVVSLTNHALQHPRQPGNCGKHGNPGCDITHKSNSLVTMAAEVWLPLWLNQLHETCYIKEIISIIKQGNIMQCLRWKLVSCSANELYHAVTAADSSTVFTNIHCWPTSLTMWICRITGNGFTVLQKLILCLSWWWRQWEVATNAISCGHVHSV